jgi:trehalose 6-phosphate synthase/phosphatase
MTTLMKVCFLFYDKAELIILDMFRSLRQSSLPNNQVFAVTVGASSKQTLASWHVLEPSDVVSALVMLNEDSNPAAEGKTAEARM